MVRAALENALPPEFVDDLYRQHAGKRKPRKLLLSTVVALLSLAVCRVRKSVHAAYQLMESQMCVGVKAVYNRLNSLPIPLIEALVRESSRRMAAVVDELRAPLVPGEASPPELRPLNPRAGNYELAPRSASWGS